MQLSTEESLMDHQQLQRAYDAFKARGLKLDLTRGKPSAAQLELSAELLTLPGGTDFIAEGVDQTRGWFFTLHAIAGMLFDSIAFKNVVSNGLVLDKEGNKMSKRLGNAVNPFETIDKYGADATRWSCPTTRTGSDCLRSAYSGASAKYVAVRWSRRRDRSDTPGSNQERRLRL